MDAEQRYASGQNMPSSGEIGEEIAALFLRLRGYRILHRNLRTRVSEFDMVAEKKNTVAFVEVKLRSGTRLTGTFESIDRKKRMHMTRGALLFIQCHPELCSSEMRFDVVGVTQYGNQLTVDHLENAFPAERAGGW